MSSTIEPGIGRKLADLFRSAQDKAVRDLADEVLDRARRDAPPSPEDDPDPSVNLREGGRVERVSEGVYDVVFDEPYAAKIHEDQRLKHPNGGGPKFLEKNVQIAAGRMPEKIAAGVRSTMRSRTGTGTRVDTRKI